MWTLTPDDRILLTSDPSYCLHVNLEHPDGANKAPGAPFSGAHLCIWKVDKHYKRQAQQFWMQSDDRLYLTTHRDYCLMLWNGDIRPGGRVDLWRVPSTTGANRDRERVSVSAG